MTDLQKQAAEVVGRLTPSQVDALMTLPLPCDADPMRWIAARTYSSIWRKSSKHWDALRTLKTRGIVESKVSRGETLWRPTKPLGLAARQFLQDNPHARDNEELGR